MYASIFGLALAGLAVDRLLLSQPLSGPQMASAEPGPGEDRAVSDGAGGAGARSPEARAPAPQPRVSVSSQLAAAIERAGVVETASTVDAFQPPAAWGLTLASLVAKEPAAAPTPAPPFDAQLTAIVSINGGDQFAARVDGRVLKVGDEHKGFTLTALSASTAVFEQGEHRVELHLRRPKPD